MLHKAGEFDPEVAQNVALIKSEKEVIKALSRFPIVIEEASRSYAPSGLTSYCYDLVKLYNQFYQNVKILPETDKNIRSNRLILSNNLAQVISKSLHLLGIHAPKRM